MTVFGIMPEVGTRWKHPRLRWQWRVKSVTAKYVTLHPITAHTVRDRKIPAEDWPLDFDGEWTAA